MTAYRCLLPRRESTTLSQTFDFGWNVCIGRLFIRLHRRVSHFGVESANAHKKNPTNMIGVCQELHRSHCPEINQQEQGFLLFDKCPFNHIMSRLSCTRFLKAH